MNILPLVLALLLILALGSYSFLQDTLAIHKEEKAFIGGMHAETILRNKQSNKSFTAKKEKSEAQHLQGAKRELKDIPYVSRRVKENLHDNAKLNIASLAGETSQASYQLLYETSARLIRHLYEKAPFFKAGLEYQVLDLFIKRAKEDKELSSFTELCSSDHPLRDVLYKMAKGTNQYQIGTSRGYPPLEDFLIFDRDPKRKPINFCFASKPLLIAAFGEGLTETFMEQEKKKWEIDHKHHTVKKLELEQLFLKEGNSEGRAITDYYPLMGFSHTAARSQTTIAKDKKTGIKRKQEPQSSTVSSTVTLPSVYGPKK